MPMPKPKPGSLQLVFAPRAGSCSLTWYCKEYRVQRATPGIRNPSYLNLVEAKGFLAITIGTIGQLDTDSWEGSWRCWNRALLGYLFLPLRLLLPQHAIRVLLVKGFQPYTKVVIICITGVRLGL